jgi:hydroxyethylthiazole kinase-like uncharacterized protein yjeF
MDHTALPASRPDSSAQPSAGPALVASLVGPRRVLPALDHRHPAWPLHDSASARALEAHAAAQLPPHTLMQRAGLGVARLALALAPHARCIWIVAGPGNNGGDGFEAALHLARAGRAVQLHWLGTPEHQPPDATAALARAQAAGLSNLSITRGLATPPALQADDLAIDALLGRGLTRAVQGELADAIARLNDCAAPVLAVDLPSGLPADSGALPPAAPCVRSRWTLALLSLSPGLFTADGRDHAGAVWLDDLGVEPLAQAPCAWLGAPGVLAAAWPARRHAQHKGSFGDVWVVAGAPSMGGAALLAGRAALHAGAGRVYLQPLDSQAARLDPQQPELMFAARPSPAQLATATVVAGCGGSSAMAPELPSLLSAAGRLLLDADALNAVAASADLQTALRARRDRGQATVLTPHPLEAARLLGCSSAELQSDRLGAARRLSERFGAVIVLKGSGSVLCRPDDAAWINPTGNAALATPGSGDVLAGWLGGLWSQCAQSPANPAESAWLAARSAVWSHGRAAEQLSPAAHALPAGALLEALRAQPPVR